MYNSDFAVVDVETTGLSAPRDRIIEIAVLKTRGGEVVETYSTLVDPGMTVPPSIESLTGITNGDLQGAPTFASIRDEVHSLLAGAVFVAHNVRFDYGFVREEFRRQGMGFSATCLCTMKLSRLLFPRYRKHGLDSIMERFDLKCTDRHRALGDALLVWDFIKVLSSRFQEEKLTEAFRKVSKTPALPPFMEESHVKDLPESGGVYVFYDLTGSPLYVGKGKNIKSMVYSRFQDGCGTGGEKALFTQTARVETTETAGELGSLLLESRLIKELRPSCNRRSREGKGLVAVKKSLDDEGYGTVRIERADTITPDDLESVVAVFKSPGEAEKFLRRAAKEHGLCPVRLGLEKGRPECSFLGLDLCKGACTGAEAPSRYNPRFAAALAGRGIREWPYPGPILIEETGAPGGAKEAFLVDRWCLLASYGFDEYGTRRTCANGCSFDYDTYRILLHYMGRCGPATRIRGITREEAERLLTD